jgi:hypothetical protein
VSHELSRLFVHSNQAVEKENCARLPNVPLFNLSPQLQRTDRHSV